MHDFLQHYPKDIVLFNTRREDWWGEKYRQEVQSSVDTALTLLDLDKPWEEIHADSMKEAVANMLFGAVLSCFGPKISEEQLLELNEARFRNSIHNVKESDPGFTSNHRSVSVRLRSPGPVFSYHMPAFAAREDGKPTIGDISPISISQQDGGFQLHLTTPSGHTWYKQLDVLPAADLVNQPVGKKGGTVVFARDIASPCVSKYQVMVLRDTCERKSADCAMCSVPRGTGIIIPERWTQISRTLDLLIDEAMKRGDTLFYQTLSGGSTDSGDGGFSTGHELAMGLIEEKLRKGDKIKAKLELEMMLPPDKNLWMPVIEKLNHYVEDLGWGISLAINMEALPDEWRRLFMPGTKGTLTLADHIEFARVLKEKTGGKIQMSTLVMFGMKPVEMEYGDYMLADLKLIKELIEAGIHVDYGPCKNDLDTKYETFPPPDPVFYMIQYLALKKMIIDAKLPPSHGCVGSCSRCHQTEATSAVLAVARRQNISLPEKLAPILRELGQDYTKAFTEVFS